MASRAVIEQAKGVLMGQRRCSADEAFDILVGLSQQANRKLRDVAQALVEQSIGRTPA
jgi:AmiR/NasT family two-component response regulator